MSWPRNWHVAEGETVEIQLPWTSLTAVSSTAQFVPAGPWNLIGTYDQIRGWGELAASSGNIEVTPAVQVATGTSNPGVATGSSTTFTDVGVYEAGTEEPVEDASTATYLRVGWLISSPDNEVVHAYAGGMVELSVA